MNSKLTLIYFYGTTLAVCVLIYFFSGFLARVDPLSTDLTMINRSIESPIKLFFNGYMGQFFHFKMIGTILWLAFIVIIIYLFQFSSFPKSHKILFISYLVLVSLISFKGYFNYRYQLTLYPVSLILILYFVHNTVNIKDSRYYNHIMLSLLLFHLSNFNNADFIKKIADRLLSAKEKIVAIAEKPNNHSLDEILIFIKSLQGKKFIVNDLSLFYYYTEQQGIYFWAEKEIYYDENGYNQKLQSLQSSQYGLYLKDSLHVDYVFSTERYNSLSPKFEKFLQDDCTIVMEAEEHGNRYLIHRIK